MSTNKRIVDRDYPTLKVPENWRAVAVSYTGEGEIQFDTPLDTTDSVSHQLERDGEVSDLAFDGLGTITVVSSSGDFALELMLEEQGLGIL